MATRRATRSRTRSNSRFLSNTVARPEPPGELPVRMGGEVGQHAEVDLRRGDVHGVEHVEAAAFGEMDVEQHQVGPQGEDVADRGHGAVRLADDLRAGNRGEHRGEVPAGHEGVFNQEDFHAASVRAAVSSGDPERANRLTGRANRSRLRPSPTPCRSGMPTDSCPSSAGRRA